MFSCTLHRKTDCLNCRSTSYPFKMDARSPSRIEFLIIWKAPRTQTHFTVLMTAPTCSVYIVTSQLISLFVSTVLPWRPRRTWPPRGACWNPYKAGSTRWPVSFIWELKGSCCSLRNQCSHVAFLWRSGSLWRFMRMNHIYLCLTPQWVLI